MPADFYQNLNYPKGLSLDKILILILIYVIVIEAMNLLWTSRVIGGWESPD